MAKKAPSKHSRAARRATSPGIDLDKSLKNAKLPSSSVESRPSVLGIHQAAGVTKKIKKHGRKSVLSSKARRRQERGLDRAAAVVERTAQKVQRSKTQSRTIQSRRKDWDEINSRIVKDTDVDKKKQSMFGALDDGADEDGEDDEVLDSGDEAVRQFYDDLDEDMGEAEGEATSTAAADLQQPPATVTPAAVPLPAPLDGEDEIL